LFTVDATATPEQVVKRYAVRWSIEPANAVGKQQVGVGQARNRVKNAVERTVPFGMLIQSLVVIWCTLHGHHPTTTPTTPSPADSPNRGTRPRPNRPSKT
jgi:hypothetical protein